MSTVQEIKAAAATLTPAERAEPAQWLTASEESLREPQPVQYAPSDQVQAASTWVRQNYDEVLKKLAQ